MSASHFFVGLGAGIAILAVPVLTLTPGVNLPHRLADWIDGPSTAVSALQAIKGDAGVVSRPQSGYRNGDPTPVVTAEAPPTLQPRFPTPTPQALPQAAVPSMLGPGSGGSTLRTGVIHSGGKPVPVRRVAGVDSGDDPQIADGSPVLVSTGAGLAVGGTQWRVIRGLNGIVGWVPGAEVAVDGEAQPTAIVVALAASPTPRTGAGAQTQAAIANTDGIGVVLRNSPNDADRSRIGLMDGTRITLIERSAAGDWLHVRDDKGREGWLPAGYVATTN